MSSKKRVVFAIALICVIVAGSYLVVVDPSTALFTQVSLSQSGTGSFSSKSANNETISITYDNITIKFGIPSGGLNPGRLQFHIRAPQNLPISIGTGAYLQYVNLTYSIWSYPHWLIHLPRLTAGAFTADVTNPDRSIVGGYTFCSPTAGCSTNNGDSTIMSGATITLTFPDDVNSTQGYVFTAIYLNSLGGITNLTLS